MIDYSKPADRGDVIILVVFMVLLAFINLVAQHGFSNDSKCDCKQEVKP